MAAIKNEHVLKMLCDNPVIPAARTYADFKYAIENVTGPSIILLFGDINVLPGLLSQAQQHKKRLLIHLDLLDGVGKDYAGIKMLAKMGVTALITTKPHLAKGAREEGMLVVQRLFLMDSEALRSGLHLLHSFKPDAIEVLPAMIPAGVVRELAQTTGLPILAGGLVFTVEDVAQAIKNGICAVSTSKRELWNCMAKF